MNRWKVWMTAMTLLLVVVLAACSDEGETDGEAKETEGKVEASADWPETLRVGVVPSEDESGVSERMEQFTEQLGDALNLDTEVFMGTDYNAVIEAMRTGNIDIAFFGPFAYVLANERSGAEVFAIGGKSEDDITYTSAIIVPKDSTAKTLSDLKGTDFLFVDPASTSGHIFPRAKVIEELGVTNDEVEEQFKSVSFSGSHDASILAIVNGQADGAAVATDVMETMIDQGVVSEDDFTIIAQSDPIPRGPDAYRGDLPDDLKEAIQTFYYEYEDDKFFEERGISGFYPVNDEAFDVVRETAERLGMSPEELLK
ncbi:phosphate/phosphite/phosphonate ABC transporter substrate-binding protein [Planococcaceae bacterium Storch 2/2-2]|nr:phosphate/phosphite/phosphonate ABC transporter substrate-binding protein [Planococcaceae bacterium Storch 2/2-2]